MLKEFAHTYIVFFGKRLQLSHSCGYGPVAMFRGYVVDAALVRVEDCRDTRAAAYTVKTHTLSCI